MLRFLEISAASQNLLSDLGAFEDLGFQSLQVNEAWAHQYGVMGDGFFHVGLHGRALDTPALTFVLPDLARHIAVLQGSGIHFDFVHISEQHFHNAGFTDSAGQNVWLLEARTYSPTLPEEDQTSHLGEFCEIRIPGQNDNHREWAALGCEEGSISGTPVRLDEHTQRLTVVYQSPLEALVMKGTRMGWPQFSITKENEGLVKTAHGFDFLIKDTPSDD